MLAKLFSILLGIFGVTTVTIYPPAQPASTKPQTQTSTSTKNVNGVTEDFSILKSSGSTPDQKKSAVVTTSTSTTTTQPKTTSPKPATPAATPASIVSPIVTSLPIVVTPTPPPINWTLINQAARGALVNILCTSQSGGSFEPLSGSGVIIDPRGIILTNAHIGQYLLLEDYKNQKFINCIARSDSPATPKYILKLLYISKRWVQDNYQKISKTNPTDTLLLFSNGKVVCTGTKSEDEVHRALDMLVVNLKKVMK